MKHCDEVDALTYSEEEIRMISESFAECAVFIAEAASAIERFASAGVSGEEIFRRLAKNKSNNWRKMHGLPMRRKGGWGRGRKTD